MDNRETKLKENSTNSGMSRSNRNSKLYRQVYGKYQDLDNLPLEDNTDEIDIDSLKQLLMRSEKQTRHRRDEMDFSILETRKRNVDNDKVHDINKLLEKARYENKKIREPESNTITNKSRSILETLGTGNYEGNYLKREDEDILLDSEKVESKPLKNSVNNLEMTREMKNLTRNIEENPLIDQVMADNNLSFDLLSDLKPSENTIVTEPIKDKKPVVKSDINKNEKLNKNTNYKIKKDISKKKDKPFFPMNTEDTSDIDIIRQPEEVTKGIKKVDNDFFTSSYEFSRKDFVDLDDEDSDGKVSNVFKIVLLVLAICVFVGVITYFVLNYGINK